MTPEQQRIAIAEALDLEVLGGGKLSPHGTIMVRRKHMTRRKELTDWYSQKDWLSDLNAMHEAEMSRWIGNFEKLHNDVATYREWKDYQNLLRHNIHAPACCRAEAFVRVIGQWQDTPAPLPPKADDPNHIAGAGF